MKKLTVVALAILAAGAAAVAQPSPLTLWYAKPAVLWTDALPVGNGRMGAMIFGGAAHESIQFNESTVWTGEPHDYAHKGASQSLAKIRELLWAGKQKEAEDLAMKEFMSEPLHQKAYQSFGDLIIETPGAAKSHELQALARPGHRHRHHGVHRRRHRLPPRSLRQPSRQRHRGARHLQQARPFHRQPEERPRQLQGRRLPVRPGGGFGDPLRSPLRHAAPKARPPPSSLPAPPTSRTTATSPPTPRSATRPPWPRIGGKSYETLRAEHIATTRRSSAASRSISAPRRPPNCPPTSASPPSPTEAIPHWSPCSSSSAAT